MFGDMLSDAGRSVVVWNRDLDKHHLVFVNPQRKLKLT